MPMIEMTTTEKISKTAELSLKDAFSHNIAIFPEKSASRVLVALQSERSLYFGGQEGPAALISVSLYQPQPEETYGLYTKKVLAAVLKALPTIPKERIYIKYLTLEHKAWGGEVNL